MRNFTKFGPRGRYHDNRRGSQIPEDETADHLYLGTKWQNPSRQNRQRVALPPFHPRRMVQPTHRRKIQRHYAVSGG